MATDTGLSHLLWPNQDHTDQLAALEQAPDHPVLKAAAAQLGEYFAGGRQTFDVPLDLLGTPFQLQVWTVLQTIPYGQTRTYGDQARLLGDVKKTRAVGVANGQNPVSIIVPCHRVIGQDGSLTGFGGGLATKEYLLALEQGRAPDALQEWEQADLFGG
ncbi:MAG: methylated-DNA--[protein]-cysteine S-methyltransferase [Candidatus Latescibacteria bacterium]|nr:methylated-DNA--[protein]-cysteine S-methyltransferase [Candidatus Latescibacterota bacterium]